MSSSIAPAPMPMMMTAPVVMVPAGAVQMGLPDPPCYPQPYVMLGGCCSTVERQPLVVQGDEQVKFHSSFGHFSGGCCKVELGRDTLAITDRRIVISQRSNFRMCCSCCMNIMENTVERPARTLIGLRWDQTYGQRTCFCPGYCCARFRELECLVKTVTCQAPLEVCCSNLRCCHCCSMDAGRQIRFMFPDRTEYVTLATNDYYNSVRAIESVIGAPPNQFMPPM